MRNIQFSDGFSSSVEPTITQNPANQYQQFIDDSAFVANKGSAAAKSDVYFNTTSNNIRYYDGTAWQNIATQAELDNVQDNLDGYILSNDSVVSDIQDDLTTKALASDLTAHVSDTTDAHAASTISNTPAGNLVATNVQDALNELQSDIDTRALSATAVTLTDTQSISNKTITASDIDGGTASNTSRITLPKAAKSTLDALTRKEGTVVYATDEDKVYYDDGTVLKPVGSGSGTINFITNPDGSSGTTGWTEGSFAAAARPSGTFTPSSGAGAFAISTTTTTPLGTGTTSFLLTKSSGSSRQGRAVVSDFVLPLDYRAKVLKIDVNYIINSGTFVAGSNTTDSSLIWYAAFSTDNGATYTLAEPSSFKLLSNSTTISDRFSGSIQTPYNATNMRLIAYVAETANSAWVVECITSVSPSQYVYGSPVSDLGSYAPVFTNLGTVTNHAFEAYRIGKKLRVKFRFIAASGGASAATVSLPSGLVASTTGNEVIGAAWAQSTTSKDVFITTTNGATTVRFITNNGSGGPINGSDFGTGIVDGWFEVDILGWSSSTQQSDGYDGRVVAFSGYVASTYTPGVHTPINLTAVRDTLGGWSTNTYTVRSPGDYLVSMNLFNATAAQAGLRILLNGTPYKYAGYLPDSSIGSGATMLQNLKVGDTIAFAIDSTNTILGTSNLTCDISKLSGSPTISASETVACRYVNSSGFSVPTGTTPTKVTGWTKTFDTHGAFNPTTGTFTASEAGLYHVGFKFFFDNNKSFTATTLISAWIYKDNAQLSRPGTKVVEVTGATLYQDLQGDDLVPLNAGQTIDFRLVHGEGTSRELATSGDLNYVYIYKVK